MTSATPELYETTIGAVTSDPVEQLCFLGIRAMGALEFRPMPLPHTPPEPWHLEALVQLANDALASRLNLPQPDLTELYRRALFNILARNQDDHTRTSPS